MLFNVPAKSHKQNSLRTNKVAVDNNLWDRQAGSEGKGHNLKKKIATAHDKTISEWKSSLQFKPLDFE